MRKESQYSHNRNRVFEIYGVDPNDPEYNCHHIIPKSEGGTDRKPNLIPLKIEDHNELHRRIDQMEKKSR